MLNITIPYEYHRSGEGLWIVSYLAVTEKQLIMLIHAAYEKPTIMEVGPG